MKINKKNGMIISGILTYKWYNIEVQLTKSADKKSYNT